MNKILCFIVLLALSVSLHAQTATIQQMENSIDSFSHRLDSVVMRSVLTLKDSMYILDTLTLPPNTAGIFTLSLFGYDTVAHFVSINRLVIGVTRIGTVYSPAYLLSNPIAITTGLSVHQTYSSVANMNGMVIVRVDGFQPPNPIRWHVWREARISPL